MDLSKYSSGSDLVPDGQYTVQVNKYEEKKTKDGRGEYINLGLKIISSVQNGRMIFVMFNTKNDNDLAVDIGMGQLKSLATAAGISVTNVTEKTLMNSVFDIKVGNKTDGYGEKNVVKKYMPSTLNSLPKADMDIPF